ncbi:hypothetical protein ACB092_11G044000 [Castanea dentata]
MILFLSLSSLPNQQKRKSTEWCQGVVTTLIEIPRPDDNVTQTLHLERIITILYYHNFVMVTMKGFYIEMVKIQNLFTTIDFSNNSFKGEIPKSIGMLKSLKGLYFSHNNLIGHMPPSLGNLNNLEWLDLSSNMLIGEIPGQLADITYLEVLNLSENRLMGMIP